MTAFSITTLVNDGGYDRDWVPVENGTLDAVGRPIKVLSDWLSDNSEDIQPGTYKATNVTTRASAQLSWTGDPS